MAVPTNKEELQKAIHSNYEKLQKELVSIPLELTSLEELVGHAKGTSMSINNLIAYLIGWGELVLKWNKGKEMGVKVEFPETGYKWNQLGQLAQKFYTDYKNDDFTTLQKKLQKNVDEILELIAGKTNTELYEFNWYEKWPFGRMIQFNTASPYSNARARIRQWKKERKLIT